MRECDWILASYGRRDLTGTQRLVAAETLRLYAVHAGHHLN